MVDAGSRDEVKSDESTAGNAGAERHEGSTVASGPLNEDETRDASISDQN